MWHTSRYATAPSQITATKLTGGKKCHPSMFEMGTIIMLLYRSTTTQLLPLSNGNSIWATGSSYQLSPSAHLKPIPECLGPLGWPDIFPVCS